MKKRPIVLTSATLLGAIALLPLAVFATTSTRDAATSIVSSDSLVTGNLVISPGRVVTDDYVVTPDSLVTRDFVVTPDRIVTRDFVATPDHIVTRDFVATPDGLTFTNAPVAPHYIKLADHAGEGDFIFIADNANKTATEASKADSAAVSADSDAHSAELDAKLAEARARLEQAAHDVAELSKQMGAPLMERLMAFNGEGPPRAVIGVQLDTASGKDGARVQEVSPGGPAADAGLKTGDVIVALNGTDVKGDDTARQVLHLMRDVTPDSKVKVKVLRDGKPHDFVITARPGMGFMGMHEGMHEGMREGMRGPPRMPHPPGEPGSPPGDFHFEPPMMFHGSLVDMELATLTPQLGRYFGTDKGVLVVRAPREDTLKLQEGDVILAIDGREPASGSHATRILGSYQPGEKISIKLMRDHKTITVQTALPEKLGPGPGPGHGEGPPTDRKVRMIRKDAAPT